MYMFAYRNLLFELLPKIRNKNNSRKQIKPGIDSVIKAIEEAEEEERRRVLAGGGGVSEEEYDLKRRADEEDAELIAKLFTSKK